MLVFILSHLETWVGRGCLLAGYTQRNDIEFEDEGKRRTACIVIVVTLSDRPGSAYDLLATCVSACPAFKLMCIRFV